MRIALISFEFPPETAYGGIASYMHENARMLAAGGHSVEVFCAGKSARSTTIHSTIQVHTIPDMDKDSFAESLIPVFTQRHNAAPFDVVESPDIYADGRAVRAQFPRLPLFLKVHTPSFLLHRLNPPHPISLAEKLRFSLGGLRRGRIVHLKPNLSVLKLRNQREPALYHSADAVASPSRDLIRIIETEWGKRNDGIIHLPYPYSPDPKILATPPAPPSAPLLYLGRLEMRKGFSDLIEALVLLEKKHKAPASRFVGASFPSPHPKKDMETWAKGKLPQGKNKYTFTGMLSREAAVHELIHAGLVVLPSRWENFPYTCLEAMAAGRVVLGSSAGGMADMITDGVNGFLIAPHDATRLAERINNILENASKYEKIGENARYRVLNEYAPQTILPQQIAAYERTIAANREKFNAGQK